MAGWSISLIESRPNISCISNQPSTHPGTDTGKGPYEGMNSKPFFLKYSSFNDRGERPLALSPKSFFLSELHIIANRSPPTPQPVGSTSPSTAFAAIAASIALPPFFSISRATWVASGWLVAAIPFFAITSDLVAKSRPVILFCEYETAVITNIRNKVKNPFIFLNLFAKLIKPFQRTYNSSSSWQLAVGSWQSHPSPLTPHPSRLTPHPSHLAPQAGCRLPHLAIAFALKSAGIFSIAYLSAVLGIVAFFFMT